MSVCLSLSFRDPHFCSLRYCKQTTPIHSAGLSVCQFSAENWETKFKETFQLYLTCQPRGNESYVYWTVHHLDS